MSWAATLLWPSHSRTKDADQHRRRDGTHGIHNRGPRTGLAEQRSSRRDVVRSIASVRRDVHAVHAETLIRNAVRTASLRCMTILNRTRAVRLRTAVC